MSHSLRATRYVNVVALVLCFNLLACDDDDGEPHLTITSPDDGDLLTVDDDVSASTPGVQIDIRVEVYGFSIGDLIHLVVNDGDVDLSQSYEGGLYLHFSDVTMRPGDNEITVSFDATERPVIDSITVRLSLCGDAMCDDSEDQESCPVDCLVCGDASCDAPETVETCSLDCDAFCGDGLCTSEENVDSCAEDCPDLCGDLHCSSSETVESCEADCLARCGDELCTSPGEDVLVCPGDCPSVCGDGHCTHDENAESCNEDCPSRCDDGVCTEGETFVTCPEECPANACSDNAYCDDLDPCNGVEVCDGECVAGAPSPEFASCTTVDGEVGFCLDEVCITAMCGNGDTDPGEVCDDGDDDNTDECLSTCRAATCGDGYVHTGVEDCDGTEESCLTSCGTMGILVCEGCIWADSCTPPVETCNGVDDDCDGSIDLDQLWYLDADGDGYGRLDDVLFGDCDPPAPSYVSFGGDCNDDPLLGSIFYPDAPELCDGRDNDCDGVIPLAESDGDGDGVPFCADCDDWDPLIYLGAPEVCNGVDDNCNGIADEGC